MHWRRWMIPLAVLVCLGLLAGCGPVMGTIQGEVTVDGKPIEKGIIVFAPAASGCLLPIPPPA